MLYWERAGVHESVIKRMRQIPYDLPRARWPSALKLHALSAILEESQRSLVGGMRCKKCSMKQ